MTNQDNKEYAKHFNYCTEHGLKIYPVYNGGNDYKIVVARLRNRKWIETKGNIRYSIKPKQGEAKWWEVIQDLYKHYYLMATDVEYNKQHKEKANEKKR